MPHSSYKAKLTPEELDAYKAKDAKDAKARYHAAKEKPEAVAKAKAKAVLVEAVAKAKAEANAVAVAKAKVVAKAVAKAAAKAAAEAAAKAKTVAKAVAKAAAKAAAEAAAKAAAEAAAEAKKAKLLLQSQEKESKRMGKSHKNLLKSNVTLATLVAKSVKNIAGSQRKSTEELYKVQAKSGARVRKLVGQVEDGEVEVAKDAKDSEDPKIADAAVEDAQQAEFRFSSVVVESVSPGKQEWRKGTPIQFPLTKEQATIAFNLFEPLVVISVFSQLGQMAFEKYVSVHTPNQGLGEILKQFRGRELDRDLKKDLWYIANGRNGLTHEDLELRDGRVVRRTGTSTSPAFQFKEAGDFEHYKSVGRRVFHHLCPNWKLVDYNAAAEEIRQSKDEEMADVLQSHEKEIARLLQSKGDQIARLRQELARRDRDGQDDQDDRDDRSGGYNQDDGGPYGGYNHNQGGEYGSNKRHHWEDGCDRYGKRPRNN
jgi:hypothetical protein